jgi:hypothetical protein
MELFYSNIHAGFRGSIADQIRSRFHKLERNTKHGDKSHRSQGLNRLTLFGLFAVTAMLVCYAFENRSRWFILAFAVACLLGSVYGFLQGAWPFGLVEAIWSVVAVRRWWVASRVRS